MNNWAPRPGDDKVQESAATLARISFDPSRLEELTFGELGTLLEGVLILLQRNMKQISVRTVKLISQASKHSEDTELMLQAYGAMLGEKSIMRELRQYAQGMG